MVNGDIMSTRAFRIGSSRRQQNGLRPPFASTYLNPLKEFEISTEVQSLHRVELQ